MSFSLENCTYKMFDSDTGVFIKPDSETTYEWPADRVDSSNNPVVVDWNTWVRCFGYWLRDKFSFDIFSGDGGSFGRIGRLQNRPHGTDYWYQESSSIYFEGSTFPDDYHLPDNRNIQQDNDWANDDYGLAPMVDDTNSNCWEEYRAPSPFRPQQINGINYYTDGTLEDGKLKWTGKWNNQIFDDENNRFDIIFQSNNFNNLGVRIKFPLTTTTTRCYSSDHNENNIYDETETSTPTDHDTLARHCDTTNLMGIIPFLTATLNKQQIAKLSNSYRWLCNWSFSGFSTSLLKFPKSDFTRIFLPQKFVGKYDENANYDFNSHPIITIKKNGNYRWYVPSQSYSQKGTVVENSDPPSDLSVEYRSNLGDSDGPIGYIFNETPGIEPFGWTKDTFEKLTESMTPYLFENTGRVFNYIRYYTSYDNSVLYLTIIDSKGNKGVELIFYKNEDNTTSGLLISEATPQSRGSSKSWFSNNGVKYWKYKNDTGRNYGNIGGLIVSSSGSNGNLDNFEATPLKYYRDARDVAIDDSGMWCLEKLCPLSNQETYCKNLYLVTRLGTSSLVNEFKKITCTINGVKTNFVVFPFNNKTLSEVNNTDSLTLLAIPIEQEV